MDLDFANTDLSQRDETLPARADTDWTAPDLPSTRQVDGNIYKERLFREAVLEWLNNGKPKLFRSPYEGNCIVRLSNITFTADDKLSRMIGTFTATATEIADYSMTEIKKYGLISTPSQPTMAEVLQEASYWQAQPVSLMAIAEGTETDSSFSAERVISLTASGLESSDRIKVGNNDIISNASGTYKY
jgi:hypothetical protein